jgi:hypothetical protein
MEYTVFALILPDAPYSFVILADIIGTLATALPMDSVLSNANNEAENEFI